jgi:hypothetical protein
MKRALLMGVVTVLAALVPGVGVARAHATGVSSLYTGSWYVHGFTLTVSGTSVSAVYRTYTWCSPHRKYGCDKIVGNNIYDGGVWTGLVQHAGATRASGTIYAGADSSLLGAPFTLHRRPNDFLVLLIGTSPKSRPLTLCGPNVPTSMRFRCGA